MCRMRWQRLRGRGKREEVAIASMNSSVGSNEYFLVVLAEHSYSTPPKVIKNLTRPSQEITARDQVSGDRQGPVKVMNTHAHTHTREITKTRIPLHSQRMLRISLRATPPLTYTLTSPFSRSRFAAQHTSACPFPSLSIAGAS